MKKGISVFAVMCLTAVWVFSCSGSAPAVKEKEEEKQNQEEKKEENKEEKQGIPEDQDTTETTPICLSVDYRNQWDTLRVLSNPHKGWYHHYYSNGTWNYGLTAEEDGLLRSFPGMDHIYLRLAWSYFEKKEGVYDWSLIDNIVNKYVPMGYGISLRITCHETGSAPNAVGQNVGGRNYATPYWVRQAGAKGTDIPKGGSTAKCWCPDYGDPIFLEKLENFHKSLAARYDGQPWLRYVDVGSMGDWGEGHTSFSINQMISDDVVKKHFDIYARCYKKTPVVAMENSMSYKREKEPNWGSTHSESIESLICYAHDKGFGLRCDSYMVDWYIKIGAAKWAIMRPYMYEKFYRDRLIVHESDHYDHVIEAGNWIGNEGEGYVEKAGCSGRDLFVNSMILTHPTYIGYHGHLKKWLSENPGLTKYLANKCGYWIFPVTAELQDETITVQWLNNGVAPCLHEYALRLHFFDKLGADSVVEIPESGNMAWMPGKITQNTYSFKYPEAVKGKSVRMYMELYDHDTERTVDVGLSSKCLFRKYIPVGEIDFK